MKVKTRVEKWYETPNNVPVNLPVHLFVVATLITGIAFVCPPAWFGVISSPLYQFSSFIYPAIPIVWGSLVLIGILILFLGTLLDKPMVSKLASFMQFLLSMYVAFAYLASGYLVGLFAIAIPLMIFWAWLNIKIMKHNS